MQDNIMDVVFEKIRRERESQVVPQKKRKTRETQKAFSLHSDDDTVSSEQETQRTSSFSSGLKKKKTIDDIYCWNNVGKPFCCSKHCLDDFQIEDIENTRKYVCSLSAIEKRSYIQSAIDQQDVKGKKINVFQYNGLKVC